MGFATSPFATSPFGAAFYAVPTDETADTAAACRVLGVDGDYEVDDDGNLRDAEDPTDEEIYWRLATVAGSYAGDLTAGNGVTKILVANSTSRVAIAHAVKLALEPMRARGAIRDVSVAVEQTTEQGTTRAAYRVDVTKTGIDR